MLVAVIREFKSDTSLCGSFAGLEERSSTLSVHAVFSPFQYGDQARSGRYLIKRIFIHMKMILLPLHTIKTRGWLSLYQKSVFASAKCIEFKPK